MKKSASLLFCLVATLGLILSPSFGQEDTAPESTASEVDAILAELEVAPTLENGVEVPPEPIEPDEGIQADTVVAESEVEDGLVLEEADSEEIEDSSAVPAISLEEATVVEGLDIEGVRDITEGLISVNYEEVPLADIVKIFAQTSGANIIIPQNLIEPVSGNLNDVYWRDALDVILADKGYVLVERTSGIFTINAVGDIAAEPLKTDTIELQFITAEAALPAVQGMIISSNANVTPIPQSNVLIVNESAKQLSEIKRIVALVDKPRNQVFIEAKFVELNDSAIKDLGINWSVLQAYTVGVSGLTATFEETQSENELNGRGNARSSGRETEETRTFGLFDGDLPDNDNGFSDIFGVEDTTTALAGEGFVEGRNIAGVDPATGAVDPIPTYTQNISRSAVLSASDFALTLSALQQLDGVRIVSNPKILVANGQTAEIHVGRNEPDVRPVAVGDTGTNFAYELQGFIPIGVKLTVTPIINTAKNITINITPELSRLIGEKTVGEASTTFPITSTRTIKTEFAVESGKTVAIGGLTSSDESEDIVKVPLLGDIPLIGKYLFTSTSTRVVQDEIIIFVTVDTARSDEMDNREGIPTDSKLIHTWLDYEEKDKKAPLRPLSN